MTWRVENMDVIEWANQYNGPKFHALELGLENSPGVWYNISCLDRRTTGRFVFSNAATQHNNSIVGKAPLVSGLTSRRLSKQLRQANKGRFFIMATCQDCKKYTSTGKRCRECYVKSKSVVIPCDFCGKQIRLIISKSKSSKKHFCSMECVSNAKRKGTLKGKSRSRTTLTCPICKSKFERLTSYVKESEKIGRLPVCSRQCRIVWIEWDCETCGKHVKRQRNRVGIAHQRRFCSPECASIGLRGDGNPAWRGGYEPYYGGDWQEQRRLARKRDAYTCQGCGVTELELKKELDVHHKKRFGNFESYREANDLNNLISLCHSCHMELEWQTGDRGNV